MQKSQVLTGSGTTSLSALETSFLKQLPIGIAVFGANGIVDYASEQFSQFISSVCGPQWQTMELGTIARSLEQSNVAGQTFRTLPLNKSGTLVLLDETASSPPPIADALTGLPGRVALRDRYTRIRKKEQRAGELALILLDLDRFKAVNDSLGHPVGDGLLCRVADRLRKSVRSDDLLVRLGGDEFAIIQGPAQQPAAAEQLGQRLVDLLSRSYLIDEHLITIGASVGIAFSGVEAHSFDTLMKNADLALYAAKGDGRGCYRFFEREMDERAQARRSLELELRKAIALRQFSLVFQPQVRSSDQRLITIEALLRWQHPEKGLLAPESFMAIAEETGLMVQMGEWALRSACSEATKWPEEVAVSVNLSHVQFSSRGLPQVVASALAYSGLKPGRLELEVTEGVLLNETELTLKTLHQLKALGVRVAMDQFGTGYSSLSYLRSFPFDKIKIDHSLARDMTSKKDAAAIINAVSALGASLGISVTADGVDTEGQCRDLMAAGCTGLQGSLFGDPLSSSEIATFIGALGHQDREATV